MENYIFMVAVLIAMIGIIVFMYFMLKYMKSISDDIDVISEIVLDLYSDSDKLKDYIFKNYMASKLDIKEKYKINLDVFCDEYLKEYRRRYVSEEEMDNDDEQY